MALLIAGTIAASLGNHETAQEYFDIFRYNDMMWRVQNGAQPKDLRKEQELVFFFGMVNDFCAGEEKLAAKRQKEMMQLGGRWGPSFASSWELIASTPLGTAPSPSLFYTTRKIIQMALDASSDTGLILEFGVFHGRSLRSIARRFPEEQVHGFDTFSGLPEAWAEVKEQAGTYSTQGALPSELPPNVRLHKGLFSDTLPGFLDAHPGPARFMHVDCDLYSSTKDIFDQMFSRVVPGTIILFDDFLAYPGWEQHEFKAFQEAVDKHGWTFEYLAFSIYSRQAVVRIS